MKVIIKESQLPRVVALNWLVKAYKSYKKEITEDDNIIIQSDNGTIIFVYEPETNTLKVDRKKVWKVLYRDFGFDTQDSKLIILAFLVEEFGLKNIKLNYRLSLENLNEDF